LHDPSKAEERRATASKAGKRSRRGATVPEDVIVLRERLLQITEDVLAGRTTTAKGSVAGSLLGVAIRSFEVEKKQREFVELEKRLEAVEKRDRADKDQEHDDNGYPFGSGTWAR